MRRWLGWVALGALFAGCASTAAVQDAREAYQEAKAAGAKETAQFEYYAATAYLQLARQASEVEDHSRARAWSEQSRQYAAEAVRLASGAEGEERLPTAAAVCDGPRPEDPAEAARIDALLARFERAAGLDARECAPKELAIASALLDYECYAAARPQDSIAVVFPPAEPAVTTLLAATEPCWLARHDVDGDQVSDDLDACPDTPANAPVDDVGCPLDSDGDGVADHADVCADTPEGVSVRADGCPLDGDGDGVADYLDRCADTPAEAKVGADGCPLDADEDGVADFLDACADTPQGVAVQANGCPPDSDGDGVADFRDTCPDTPAEAKVGADGCPLDADGDGVADYLDACADTPQGVAVQTDGCPPDSDGDGVTDDRDACPDTAGGVAVGENGCPLDGDADGDGVLDAQDACPGTPADTVVDEAGCGPDEQPAGEERGEEAPTGAGPAAEEPGEEAPAVTEPPTSFTF